MDTLPIITMSSTHPHPHAAVRRRLRVGCVLLIAAASCLLAFALTTAAQSSPPNACAQGVRRRRSFLSLTSAERRAYADAFLQLKQSNFIDRLVAKHRQVPHGTSWFLPVHRAMLLEMESELVRVSNGRLSALPYWDELADSNNPRASRVFSTDGVGILGNGPLGAPFRGLTDDSDRTAVERRPPAGVSGQFAWAPASQIVARALDRFRTFGQMSREVEMVPHNRYHVIIGGHMGDVSRSPSDPVFWLHHCYTDLLWAVWQSVRLENAENLVTEQGQQPIRPSDRVPIYTNQYTALDTLRHRTRMCFTYDQVGTAPAPRLVRRQVTNQQPPAGSGNGTSSDTQVDPANAPPADPRAVTEFFNMIPLDDKQWQAWMPNISLETVRQVEKGYADLIDEVNKSIKDGTIKLANLEIVDDLVKAVAKNTSMEDDGKDTAIPAVAELQKKKEGQNSSASKVPVVGAGLAALAVTWVALL
ncbi:hypothetical protein BCR44DRAFT_1486205 [Catenaria anguillulae PL171]|uniref:Tyrosinase copper-binding domain-containing protein n=1 Tax=Catenaria anguillulae PL171 TaxID=765915 RepID=A0A1Y2HHP1_9FUNG|nr:hypothetical protein BCR44DRAFT_1486205 [Catenaria anguillulae PL171]